jgi:hypothetical protein
MESKGSRKAAAGHGLDDQRLTDALKRIKEFLDARSQGFRIDPAGERFDLQVSDIRLLFRVVDNLASRNTATWKSHREAAEEFLANSDVHNPEAAIPPTLMIQAALAHAILSLDEVRVEESDDNPLEDVLKSL